MTGRGKRHSLAAFDGRGADAGGLRAKGGYMRHFLIGGLAAFALAGCNMGGDQAEAAAGAENASTAASQAAATPAPVRLPIETGSYVIAAAQGGQHPNGRATYGHSIIIDPWGRIVAELDHDEPGVLLADIDPQQVTDARERIPALANARDFAAPQTLQA